MSEEQTIVQLNPDVPPTGSDLGFVNAARRSFNTRSEWNPDGSLKDKDKRLLEFLARGMTAGDFDEFVKGVDYNIVDSVYGSFMDKKEVAEKLWEFRNTPTHDTPFNHGFISFEVKAPIFVARQLVKHEYLIMSEFSRRYITDDIEFYEHNYREQSEDKKQGSSGVHKDSAKWQALSKENAQRSVDLFNKMVDDGVAIEQARGELPGNLMTEWTWSGTPGAFFKMCRERCHSEAQEETRIVANQVYDLLEQQWPVSTPLMVKGVV